MDRFKPSSSDFKKADASSYDAQIGDFARFTAMLTVPLAVRMISRAGISPGQRVLDIGTGTGVVILEAAKGVVLPGCCVAIDLSEKMLAAARENADAAGLADRIEFKAMDAEALEFPDTSFDVVLSLFALLHFPNPDIALQEMFRVLKPGGTMVVAVGSGPRWLSWQGLQHAVRISTDLVSRLRRRQLVAPQFLNRLVLEMIPATEQVEESPFARAGRNRTASLLQLVQAAGFENLREHWEGHETTLETVADFWDIQRTFSSIARKRLNRAQPERIAAVRKQFFLRAEATLAQGGKLTYPFAAFFVSARRPRKS